MSGTKTTANSLIRTSPRPACCLCGGDGTIIYMGQEDRLYGASGRWNFKKCLNQRCGLVWLDPMPVTEDLGKAYVNYYTHTAQAAGSGRGVLNRLVEPLQNGYFAGKYNYPITKSKLARAMGKLLYLFPLRRRALDGAIRFLESVPGGRLLDVGCGSGDWLLFMRKMGWEVEGIDFDGRAVEVGLKNGLKVQCGTLEQQNFASASFHAVVMSHVIEHLPDPVGTLSECARILRKGGRLVLLTPNSSSLGHKVFRKDWRGLEPPRHLHIFSNESLCRILERTGFEEISIRPHIAKSIVRESVLLRLGKSGRAPTSQRIAELTARLFNVVELCFLNFKPSVSDCVAAVAVK